MYPRMSGSEDSKEVSRNLVMLQTNQYIFEVKLYFFSMVGYQFFKMLNLQYIPVRSLGSSTLFTLPVEDKMFLAFLLPIMVTVYPHRNRHCMVSCPRHSFGMCHLFSLFLLCGTS